MLGYTEELRVIGGKVMSVVASLATVSITVSNLCELQYPNVFLHA